MTIVESSPRFFNYSTVIHIHFRSFQHSFKKMWKTRKKRMNKFEKLEREYGKVFRRIVKRKKRSTKNTLQESEALTFAN